ncbi:MAG: hypothetical protein KJN90_08525 [Gammaproteobacteria bacterium]|nr:hypothetical protein [Gammaproteobacteria bacterium]
MNGFGTALAEMIGGSFLQDAALFMLQNIPGFPPIIQTVHILGIAVVMGSVVLINLRLLGLAIPSQGVAELTGRVMPWFWWALASNVFSGAFFVLGRPSRYFNNPVFAWKMGFLLLAVLLALFFYLKHRQHANYWEDPARKWTRRGIALLSLAAWIMVSTAGRWIAYLEYIQYPLWGFEIFDAGPQPSFLMAVENWGLSQIIAATNWFPLIETVHVIAVTLVLGSILWVDLRLLGLAARQYPFSVLERELIPWTWGAFVVATITGIAMFITRAASHMENPAFQWKLFLLALAGINMLIFQRRVYRPNKMATESWDHTEVPPGKIRIFGAASLVIWSGVMLAGRWIGHIV